jgi:predicted nucleic-acid-binding protein
MIALDTNVIVRILVLDDIAQARRAKALVEGLTERDERAYVSDIVLCEVVWVLSRSYGFDRDKTVGALRMLLQAKQLRFESVDNALRALDSFERGKGDFADYLIREHAQDAGCDLVMTFDESLLTDRAFASP